MGLSGFVKLVRHAESDTMGQGRQDSLKFLSCRGEYQAYNFVECDIGHGAPSIPRESGQGGCRLAGQPRVGLCAKANRLVGGRRTGMVGLGPLPPDQEIADLPLRTFGHFLEEAHFAAGLRSDRHALLEQHAIAG